MADIASLQAIIYGRVQGVFFRDFVSKWAVGLGLSGYVLNLPEGMVEVQVEGEREQLAQLVEHIKVGPPAARVTKVVTNWSEHIGVYSYFSIKY